MTERDVPMSDDEREYLEIWDWCDQQPMIIYLMDFNVIPGHVRTAAVADEMRSECYRVYTERYDEE